LQNGSSDSSGHTHGHSDLRKSRQFRRVDVGAYDTQTNLLTGGSPRPAENENVFISRNLPISCVIFKAFGGPQEPFFNE
jgi:hypothetical protein